MYVERSGFFDAHVVGNEYDRVYLAESFASYFASFIGNGVFGGKSSELQVVASENGGMNVVIRPGQGYINGYWYENTSELQLKLSHADGVLNRIDNIVLRWGLQERTMWLAVSQGEYAVDAKAPALSRTKDYYELCLAQVSIRAGAINIYDSDITDKRLDNAVCGAVTGVVKQIDTNSYGYQLNTFIKRYIATADERYNSNFIPSLEDLKLRAQAAYQDFVSFLNTLSATANNAQAAYLALLSTHRSEATAEINRLIAELQGLLSGDIASALSERLTEVERKTNTNVNVATINHNKGLYPHVDLYEFVYGWGIGGAGVGPAGGGSLVSVPNFVYEMPNDNSLKIKVADGYGTVEGVYKFDDDKYVVNFKDKTVSLVIIIRNEYGKE